MGSFMKGRNIPFWIRILISIISKYYKKNQCHWCFLNNKILKYQKIPRCSYSSYIQVSLSHSTIYICWCTIYYTILYIYFLFQEFSIQQFQYENLKSQKQLIQHLKERTEHAISRSVNRLRSGKRSENPKTGWLSHQGAPETAILPHSHFRQSVV